VSTARAPSRLTAQGTRLAQASPFPELRITEADIRDPRTLQRILTQIHAAHREVSRPARGASELRRTVIDGVVFTAGQDVVLGHGFGTLVYYDIIRWVGTTSATACQYSETLNDGTTLKLHAITTGVATVRMWPA
jgi:hypothetical protein